MVSRYTEARLKELALACMELDSLGLSEEKLVELRDLAMYIAAAARAVLDRGEGCDKLVEELRKAVDFGVEDVKKMGNDELMQKLRLFKERVCPKLSA